MAAAVGRELTISRGGTVIAGARTKTISISGEPIDITTDDDAGKRALLEASGQEQIDLSVEGLAKDDVLLAIMANDGVKLASTTLTFPSGATIIGDFRFNNIELGAEYNNAVTFTAELHSSGAWNFTGAA